MVDRWFAIITMMAELWIVNTYESKTLTLLAYRFNYIQSIYDMGFKSVLSPVIDDL